MRNAAGRRFITSIRGDLAEVLGISYPVVIAMSSHTLMAFADTLMVSRFGRTELAASGPGGLAAFAVLMLVMGTANANNAFVSQSFGRGDLRECNRYTWQGIYFGFIAQVGVLPIILAGPALFGAFGHEPRIRSLETIYFQVRLCHAAGTGAYASLSSFFQGIGRPRVPMMAALAANAFNLLANFALIFGEFGCPRLGLGGAALGTVISSYVQAGILLAVLLSRRYRTRFHTAEGIGFHAGRFRRLMRIGVPSGVSSMLNLGAAAAFTVWIVGGIGETALAANNAVSQLWHVSFMPAIGLNVGVAALVGRYIGRGDISAAKSRAYAGVFLAACYMSSVAALFVLFRRPLVRIFSTSADIVAIGSVLMVIGALAQVFDAFGIICLGALRGAGDTRFAAAVSIACGWGLFLPLAYVLTRPLHLGAPGAWVASAVNIAVSGVVYFLRFKGGRWRRIDIFARREPPVPAPPA